MKQIFTFLFVLMTLSSMVYADGAVQLSLINTVQIVPENQAVTAFRLAIYGKNTKTQYFDLGIVTENTNGMSKGIQWSFVGLQNDFTGWQAALPGNDLPALLQYDWSATSVNRSIYATATHKAGVGRIYNTIGNLSGYVPPDCR